MNEELDQIEKNKTQELVPRPKDKNVIGTKWIFKNKVNEDGEVIKNKSRLVCKGYAQVEGVNFEETFALMARLEAIKIFLAFASYKKLRVYQMDVKSRGDSDHCQGESNNPFPLMSKGEKSRQYCHQCQRGRLLAIWLDGLALMSIKGSADVACDDEYGIVGQH